ncbi:glucans biosynthesis glucosyltransferase MdoH [Brevundimonas aveniformis]|uniref:glucans biosynthesis glucosyltransferase MdoH n=1 Tax=Brevundimonas aveniformis TaxID=370977 RepID=UPI002492A7F4|nr:glucans biosynthesis glucosyltransferase MdoH [Brevundimonas aveniformis]
MGDLSLRVNADVREVESFDSQPWLPAEAPLAMPRQSLDAAPKVPEGPLPTSPETVARRRWILLACTLVLSSLALIAPIYQCARFGFTALEVFGLFCLAGLLTAMSCWFSSACMGLWVLATGREQQDLAFAAHPDTPMSRTAILMPVYNEDADASFARLAHLDASLARLGASGAFDFFVLSDTNKPAAAAHETAVYVSQRARFTSRLFYRRRMANTEHKAGNLGDWVRRFGAAYEQMVVLDADSTMAGETVLRLVDAMEMNPRIGLIQTTPTIIKASTLFARVSQFSVRLYGRVAAAGLAWWTGSDSSYWGHNAIIRTRAFAECAGLPILPGVKPFGGNVLSHDVVEAAMLRRAGWGVHVTAALDGSCEETPPTITDFIRREHRWCQGNLQHLKLVGAEGLHPMSRLQLILGCVAYLASPLWLASLATGLAIQLGYPIDWGSWLYVLNPEFSAFTLASLFAALLLIGPKIMGAALAISRPAEARAFGGSSQLVKGVLSEIALSAILAPILMVANTHAVLQILRGQDAGWQVQQRDADGLAFADAFKSMRWQLVVGTCFVLALAFRPDLSMFFAPIVLPLLASPWIAMWTSRRQAGDAFAARGWMVIPEEDGSVSVAALPPVRPSSEAARRPVAQPA